LLHWRGLESIYLWQEKMLETLEHFCLARTPLPVSCLCSHLDAALLRFLDQASSCAVRQPKLIECLVLGLIVVVSGLMEHNLVGLFYLK